MSDTLFEEGKTEGAAAETVEVEDAPTAPANRLVITVKHTNADGEDVETVLYFKPLNLVPLGLIRKHRHNQYQYIWAAFEWALDEENLAKLDELPSDQLYVVLQAMQKQSGVELGE